MPSLEFPLSTKKANNKRGGCKRSFIGPFFPSPPSMAATKSTLLGASVLFFLLFACCLFVWPYEWICFALQLKKRHTKVGSVSAGNALLPTRSQRPKVKRHVDRVFVQCCRVHMRAFCSNCALQVLWAMSGSVVCFLSVAFFFRGGLFTTTSRKKGDISRMGS